MNKLFQIKLLCNIKCHNVQFLIYFIIFLLMIPLFMFSKKVTTFSELMYPRTIDIDSEKIYITDDYSIFIYSLKDFKLIKKFGRRGEGPGEFKINPKIKILSDSIWIKSGREKISIYSKEGKLIKDIRVPIKFFLFFPVKNNFVGMQSMRFYQGGGSIFTIKIFDPEYGIKKEIYEFSEYSGKKGGKMNYGVFKTLILWKTYKDKIYVGDMEKGFYMTVFDHNGKKLYEIKKKYKKIPVTKEIKKEWMNQFDGSRASIIKDRFNFVFPEYFPAYKGFTIANDNIYFFTYKKKNNKNEIVIMDLKGNNQRSVYIDIAGVRYVPGIGLKKGTIHNHKFYQLKENIDNELWELHTENIK